MYPLFTRGVLLISQIELMFKVKENNIEGIIIEMGISCTVALGYGKPDETFFSI